MGAIRRLVSTCSLALLVSACGGGGDSGVAAPTDDFDVRAAWANFLAASRSWAVSGVASNGLGYDVTISVQPGATSVMPITGATAARSDTTLLVRENGAAVSSVLSETFYDAATLQMLGTRLTPDGAASLCSLAGATAVPPSAAKIGAGGALATLDERNGCTGSSPSVGTASVGWSLAFEDGISYFCIDSTERDLAGSVLATESDCIQVSPDGSLGARARVTITQPGFSLTARG